MPNLDLRNKRLRYSAADERILTTAITLCEAARDYDAAAKLDAETARNALAHLRMHVHRQRNGGSEKQEPAA